MAKKANLKRNDFSTVSQFKYGYRNREDVTALPPGVLIEGSQNVLINAAKRVQIRKGYTLDGQASTTLASIDAKWDWQMSTGSYRNVRVYLDPTTSDGVLQYRSVDSTGVVTWVTIKTDLDRSTVRFCDFWKVSELLRVILFVDGTSNVFEWNGATTTFASCTANTITKQGTSTWAAEGFYTATTPRKIVLDGLVYTYTGG